MSWLSRLVNTFRGAQVDGDLNEELAFHVEERARDLMRRGLDGDAATAQARRELGRPLPHRETSHDIKLIPSLESIGQDIRFGVRRLTQNPGFTIAVVAVLALGIGANTAIYSAVDATLFRPLPFADVDRLVVLRDVELQPRRRADRGVAKRSPNLSDVQAETSVFAAVAAHASGGLNLVGGDSPARVAVTFVTASFFDVLGRRPSIGRMFSTEETSVDGPKAIILSDGMWRTQFGADKDIAGRRILLSGVSHEIVGVMPRDFRFPGTTDLWVAVSVPVPRSIMEAFRNYLPSEIIAKLQPGVAPARAAATIEVLRRRVQPRVSEAEVPATGLAAPLREALVGNGRTLLLMLMGSAALLLLIACANVMNLLLSRAAMRRREIAVRVALGATRARVIRQLAVETLLLGSVGAAVALIVAQLGLGALAPLMPTQLAGVAPPHIDWRVLGFALATAVGTTLVVGLWPAVNATRATLIDATKAGGWGASARRGNGTRGALVVAEISMALMLLIGAGLLLESLRRLFGGELGMRPQQVVTARLSLPRATYPYQAEKSAVVDAIVTRLRAAPDVIAAAAVSTLPMSDEQGLGSEVQPEDTTVTGRTVRASYVVVTPGYFATIGTRILAGADIPAMTDSVTPIAVINRAMGEQLWPGESPVGKRIRLDGELRVVVGVVENIRNRKLDTPATAQMYLPMSQQPQSYVSIVIRGPSSTAAAVARVREAVRAVDPVMPIYAASTLEDVIAFTVTPRRTSAILLTVFGAVALLLAGLGVYATLAYSVAQRAREIGIRMALGAQRADVARLVLGRGAILTFVGVAIGLGGALALGRVFQSLVYGVSVRELGVFAAAPAVLTLIALVAMAVPALRASRVDPIVALREE